MSWRVLDDRLRDGEGRWWTGVRGEWLTAEQVDDLLRAAEAAVVHGPRGGVRVLRGAEVARYWSMVRAFAQTPGRTAAAAVGPDGVTVAARVWRRGPDVVVGFVETC